MIEEKNEKKKDQKNWLKEHNSIQVDLLKMKDDFIVEAEKTNVDIEEKEPMDTPKSPGTGKVEKKSPRSENSSPKGQYQPDMTIKQMLGKGEKRRENKSGGQSPKEPPRLEEGSIPSSPELTSKIADVLQLENKLKRRKFEIEKRSSKREVPPPPKKPGDISSDPKETLKKSQNKDHSPVNEEIDKKIHKNEKTGSGTKNIDSPNKQIHISPNMPYPTGLTQKKEPEEVEEEDLIEEFEEFEEVEKPKPKKKKRKGLLSLFSRVK